MQNILELVDVQKIAPELEKTKVLPRDVAEKVQLIVFAAEKRKLHLLTTNNFPDQVKELLTKLTDKGYTYELFYTDIAGFNHALTWYDDIAHEEKLAEDARVARDQASGQGAISMIKKIYEDKDKYEPGDFVLQIVKLAFQAGASDLHFQSEEAGMVTKVRIDGVLQNVVTFTHAEFVKYMQKLKFISGTKMNVDYIPQDGRFSFDADDGEKKSIKVDARCNFLPGLGSENAVIRFLDSSKGLLHLEQLGINKKNFDLIRDHIHRNTGLIIIAWPTWSGKTTTLYSILSAVNTGEDKIITLEDPVEYHIPGIEQSQINYSKGYTYELGLKAILRHDPDIILIGETRTAETAEISINAALTWHLVFTTLHTNSAIEAIARMISIGVKPYMLAPALSLVCAQRLVRKIDPATMTRREATYSEAQEIKEVLRKIKEIDPSLELTFDGTVPVAVPTEANNFTGYKGRMSLTEVFEITDDIKKLIVDGKTDIDIYAKVRENGYLTLQEDGILKVLQGLTTLDELRRVL
jgi:type IV pilus assembly protein PilB